MHKMRPVGLKMALNGILGKKDVCRAEDADRSSRHAV